MKQEYSKDEYYLQRCLGLAKKGLGNTYPNPMVGSVIVHNDKIIGEGWHKKAGSPHAEVNAIASVKNKSLLKEATLYVNLEPCNHFGKTPPCANLIVENEIPRVVIGCVDSFEQVNGSGIQTLEKAGINVSSGVLEDKARELNKRFFSYHEKKRPYLILKWAQSLDGFLAPLPETRTKKAPVFLSSKEEQVMVHQWRTEEAAILIGAQTAVDDNPQLTARWVKGQQPERIILDPNNRLQKNLSVFDPSAPTHHLTFDLLELKNTASPSTYLHAVMDYLYNKGIQSVIIEGGSTTLHHFIASNLWDEARIFTAAKKLKEGIPAPGLDGVNNKALKEGLTILLPPQKRS
ncbi:MAG: bifunctional diaminohydroxyphosphoribosylaminopyrimidine deaminase/5-amino-6-(5-phosphoribosylamino)uracil reductase RibD [Flavobacteriaceae bacterium]